MGDEDGWGIFDEPADFRPPTPPPTETVHMLKSGENVHLRLVGSHPLWGHYLWNAAPTLAAYLEAHSDLVRGRSVLELGAASGLPSIAADRLGASVVVATDYPDPDLMRNLEHNLVSNRCTRSHAIGFIWGADPAPLLAHASSFDLVLMSDLIFNHQAHPALLDTLAACLAPRGEAHVFFSHHRPHLAHRDMAFFDLAQTRGFDCRHVGAWKLEVCCNRVFCLY